MKPPDDRSTPPDFGVEQEMDELKTEETPAPVANGHSNGDGYDMQVLVDGFRKLPVEEQTHRLLMLYLAIQGDDGSTRKDLANHVLEDRQEFGVLTEELTYQGQCLDLLMKHFGIEPPPRPKERPRRRE